jgi:hypothetical protein
MDIFPSIFRGLYVSVSLEQVLFDGGKDSASLDGETTQSKLGIPVRTIISILTGSIILWKSQLNTGRSLSQAKIK